MPSVASDLVHTTARIESLDANGEGSRGSGFFFEIYRRPNDQVLTLLVTNKHVVQEAARSWFHISIDDGSGQPAFGKHERVEVAQGRWFDHPDPDVDLAACIVGDILNSMTRRGLKPFIRSLGTDLLPTAALLDSLTGIEEITMVGYPNGIWDSKNNLPIVRRGVTATPVFVDYEGSPRFLIDCAVFPGSSGSPVFLYNHGWIPARDGTLAMGTRLNLIGIVHAVFQHTLKGELKLLPIPTGDVITPISRTPNNIGSCIKADQILGFRSILTTMGHVP